MHPGAADEPDVPAFRDTNCDGIDGDVAHAIFVSPVGNDASPGTRNEPKRTMAIAVAAAASQGKQVYATSGIYAERLVVADGVGVYGGYGVDWSRSLSNETRLTGGGTGEGALAINLTATTKLQHITFAPDARTAAGASSYGVRAVNSGDLVIERVVASGATGAAGSTGSAGPAGSTGVKGVDGHLIILRVHLWKVCIVERCHEMRSFGEDKTAAVDEVNDAPFCPLRVARHCLGS